MPSPVQELELLEAKRRVLPCEDFVSKTLPNTSPMGLPEVFSKDTLSSREKPWNMERSYMALFEQGEKLSDSERRHQLQEIERSTEEQRENEKQQAALTQKYLNSSHSETLWSYGVKTAEIAGITALVGASLFSGGSPLVAGYFAGSALVSLGATALSQSNLFNSLYEKTEDHPLLQTGVTALKVTIIAVPILVSAQQAASLLLLRSAVPTLATLENAITATSIVTKAGTAFTHHQTQSRATEIETFQQHSETHQAEMNKRLQNFKTLTETQKQNLEAGSDLIYQNQELFLITLQVV